MCVAAFIFAIRFTEIKPGQQKRLPPILIVYNEDSSVEDSELSVKGVL